MDTTSPLAKFFGPLKKKLHLHLNDHLAGRRDEGRDMQQAPHPAEQKGVRDFRVRYVRSPSDPGWYPTLVFRLGRSADANQTRPSLEVL